MLRLISTLLMKARIASAERELAEHKQQADACTEAARLHAREARLLAAEIGQMKYNLRSMELDRSQ